MHTVWKLESCVLYCCFTAVGCIVVLLWSCFNLVYKRRKKTRRKSPIQQLVLSSGRGRELVPKLPERSDDPFALPLKARVEKTVDGFL